ncbi:hypothetical protein [Leptolyngbya sp. FACHB-261]|uniref:hypothetical protein n=1 Tax=Leptolyngbya sp. FACHB-261 TaxID=2692806 RepID=UPI0018EF9134|nr:hypothetical protein [Leptolyngbya sp. FACHB-261]
MAKGIGKPRSLKDYPVADREADIYDLFALPRRPASHLLIRVTHNRRVDHEARYLHQSLEQTPVSGEISVAVPRQEQRPERQAKLSLRLSA